MRTEMMNTMVTEELSLEALENVNGGLSLKKVIKGVVLASTGVPGHAAYMTYKNINKLIDNYNERTGKTSI